MFTERKQSIQFGRILSILRSNVLSISYNLLFYAVNQNNFNNRKTTITSSGVNVSDFVVRSATNNTIIIKNSIF